MKSIKEQLKKPSRESQPWALWNWNSILTKEALLKQCSWFAESGFSGILIRPSRSLQPKYLSQEFYSLFSAVLEHAHQCRLHVRIADDFSMSWAHCFGTELMDVPKSRARTLRFIEQRLVSDTQDFIFQHSDTADLIVIAMKEDEGVIDPSSVVDISTKCSENILRWQVPEGSWRICIFTKEYVINPAGGGYVANPFYQKNCLAYIQTVLEPLKEQYSKMMPSVLEGFVNELPGVLPSKNSIPWDEDLVVKFRSKSKKNLIKLLPALFCDNFPGAQKCRQQIYSFIHETIGERFIHPLEEWAKKNKLSQWTLYPEKALYDPSTELIDCYIPSIKEAGAQGFQNVDGVEQSNVLLRIMSDVNSNEFRRETVTIVGRNRNGFGSTLQFLKSDIDRVLINGGSRIILDGFYTNADQYIFGKTPVSPEWYSPEGKWVKDLCSYTGRFNEILKNVHWNRQVAVLSPVSEIMASYLPSDGTSSVVALERMRKTISVLEKSGYSYDMVTEQLLTSCSIRNNGEFGTPDRIRKGNYQALIVPYAPEISRNVLIFIEKLVQKEGCVVFIEEAPSGTIEDGISATMTSRIEKILSDRHKATGVSQGDGLEEFLSSVPPVMNLTHNGKSVNEIVSACGVKDNNDIFLFYNSSQQKDQTFMVELPSHAHFYSLDCDDCSLLAVNPSERTDSVVRFQLTLAPKQMIILFGSSASLSSVATSSDALSVLDPFSGTERNYRILMKDNWEFLPAMVNNYPLTAWNVRIGLSRESGGFSHFHESHFQVKSVPSQCKLLVNVSGLGSSEGSCLPHEITINGSKVELSGSNEIISEPAEKEQEDEAPLLDESIISSLGMNFLVYNIKDFLIRGANRISLRTTECFGVPATIVYPPLLSGNFMVTKGQNGGAIDKLEEIHVPGSWVKMGFPCLCGEGIYRQSLELPNEYKKLVLCFPNVSGVIQVAMNGKELGVHKWQPMCVDITPACDQRRNEITVKVVNSIDTLLRMNGRPSGLIGDVYLDVY